MAKKDKKNNTNMENTDNAAPEATPASEVVPTENMNEPAEVKTEEVKTAEESPAVETAPEIKKPVENVPTVEPVTEQPVEVAPATVTEVVAEPIVEPVATQTPVEPVVTPVSEITTPVVAEVAVEPVATPEPVVIEAKTPKQMFEEAIAKTPYGIYQNGIAICHSNPHLYIKTETKYFEINHRKYSYSGIEIKHK